MVMQTAALIVVSPWRSMHAGRRLDIEGALLVELFRP